MKIYISGSISNDPNYLEKFENAKKNLETVDNIVVNPATAARGNTYSELLADCIRLQSLCDTTYFLSDYKLSNGAMAEYYHAKAIGHKMIFERQEVRDIITRIETEFGIDDIKSKSRLQKYVFARHIAIYIIRNHFKNLTTTEIGDYLGIDHSTVSYATRIVREQKSFYQRLTTIEL